MQNELDKKTNEPSFIGPDGKRMTLKDLPPEGTKRWVIRRKAEVVLAVKNNIISLEDACKRYEISPEEFKTWEVMISQFGMSGLRVTRIQNYRSVMNPDSH